MKIEKYILVLALSSVATVTCTSEEEEEPVVEVKESPEFNGSGDRDIRDSWFSTDVAYGNNLQMLSYRQLNNEVDRALDNTPWLDDADVDQWPGAIGRFRGANFTTRFVDDRLPSQQWLVSARKMAFSVCQRRVSAEAGVAQEDRVVFDVVDPAETIDLDASETEGQIQSLYKRFFQTGEISDDDLSTSLELLGELQTEAGAPDAWMGLCVANLTSIRFLTF